MFVVKVNSVSGNSWALYGKVSTKELSVTLFMCVCVSVPVSVCVCLQEC